MSSIVRKGEIPELPERVKEKAVLEMALSIRLIVCVLLYVDGREKEEWMAMALRLLRFGVD